MADFSSDLIALLCVYNEEELLPKCLASIEGKVDRIVVADGRYQMYPGKSDASTDRTIEIAEEFGAEIIHAPAGGWPTEHGKRTALVQSGSLGDMYFVIDADETLEGGENLRDYYGDYKLLVRGVDGTPGRLDACRLFAHRDGLQYLWHFHVVTPAGVPVLRSRDNLPARVAWVAHHHAERDEARVKADQEYEAKLVPFEASLGAYGGR